MKFPVDLLADVSLADLERSAHNYMNNLLYSNPDFPEHLTISASTKVTIDISSVGFVPLYGSNDTWKALALFSPSDPFIAVALYLLDRWWAVEDILKTADPVRDGTVEVETVGERIVLYILNRVIYRGREMTSEELPFLCHGERDYAKIVWNNGEAVGFYSVKPSGSICNSYSVRTYQLPVMDSIFVRKCQRRKGFGLQMLVDFVLSFKEESLGLRYPLTKSMYKVCEKYLCQYPGDTDLLWEVESIGGPNQRTNIARKIMAINISVSKSLSFSEESLLTPDVAEKVLKESITVECSSETMEEVTVLRATKEIDDVPVVGQGRSSGLKQRKIGKKIPEEKSEKVIRIEDIEAETPSKERVLIQRKTELHDSYELEQTEVLLSVTKEQAEDVVDTAPEGEPTMRPDKPATVLTSKDLAEADVTSATMTEEQHAEDDDAQDLINKSHDSQITVENVASETQEAEVCEKEKEADIPFSVDDEENILPVELDEEMSWKYEETPANDGQVQDSYGEKIKVIETQVLRSEKTVRTTTTIKTTKRQDGDKEEEADRVNSKEYEPAAEGVVMEGRRSAASARQQSEQSQEETEVTVTEEIQVEDSVLPKSTTDSAEFSLSDATEEAVPVEKIAVEEEEEQSKETTKREETMAEEHIHGSSVEIENSEIEKGAVEEERQEEKVEDAVTMRDTGEGSAEEKNTKSDDEEKSTVNETETQRGRKQQVTSPARHQSVRVLRSGRKSVLVTQTHTRKSTHKQIQKEGSKGGEESTAVEATEPEEEQEQAEKPSVIDQEQGETLENDATQQEENTAAETDIENMDTVAEEAVTQDAPEVVKADSTETITDGDAEALVGKAEEGMTSDVFEKEAVTGPETVEGEQSTSKVEETAAGESSDNKLLTANEDHGEETPVIETRVLRSGKKTLGATSRIKTTKRPDGGHEEEADRVKSKEDEPSEEGVVMEGRRSAATARQQSEQSQEETEEPTVTEEIQVDEIKEVLEKTEGIKETRDKKNEDKNKEEAAVQKDEIQEPEVETEQVKAVVGVSLAEQETVEKEPSTVSVTCVDREEGASIRECVEGTPDEGKISSKEEAVTIETTILRSGEETVRATVQSKTTVIQDIDEQQQDTAGETSTQEDKSVLEKRILRKRVSAAATPGVKAKRCHTVHQTEDEAESTPAKEKHIAESKDNITEEIEENDGEEDASQKDDAEDTLNTNVEKVSEEIQAPAVETTAFKSGKVVKTTPGNKTTKSHHEQNAPVWMLVETSADTDKLAVESRILRKGRRSAPATPRKKSRTQCQPEEQRDEETAPAQEMEGDENEVEQESPEKLREKAEEEGKRMGMEVEHSNDAEQGEAKSAPESVVGDTEEMMCSSIKETGVLEEDGGSKTDLVETDIIQISSAEVEETNSVEEEGIKGREKSTAMTEVVSDTAITEEEVVKGAYAVAEEDAAAATRRSLKSQTKTSHATLPRRSRSQKDHKPVKTKPQQLEEENRGNVETQEVHPPTDNSPEKRELKEEQAEAQEMSSTGHEADKDIAEYIDKETSDSRAVGSLGDETESVTDKEEEEKMESDEDKDNMTDEFSDNQQTKKLEESSKEENLKNSLEAGEKGNTLNSTLDTDEEVETSGVSQQQEKDEQNMSEDEVEPIVIGKRVLRWRTVPSVIITPRSKSRCHRAKVQKAEEPSSDEEKSPSSSKRSLRKRKSTEVTPTHKFRRSSRGQENVGAISP